MSIRSSSVDHRDTASPPSDPRHALGRRGEDLAAAHLRSQGFEVLARNVRTRRGEIDLIACDGAVLLFVEVKTRRVRSAQRRARDDQLPLSGLGRRQRARLRGLAAAWLAGERRAPTTAHTIRFDAIGVILDDRGRLRQLEHVEAAW